MWEFIKKYSYDAVKMFVTQFAIAMFGFVLTLATGLAKNKPLQIGCSVFAILFYLFLLYTSVWEMGAKDSVSISYGHKKFNPYTGLGISLLSNLLNFVLAVLIMFGNLFPEVPFFSNVGGVSASIAVFIEGMFTGVLTLKIGEAPLNSLWFVYYILPLPALLISWLGYVLGVKNVKFTKLYDYKAPKRDTTDFRNKG